MSPPALANSAQDGSIGRMTIPAAVPGSEGRSTIETRATWAVCLTALAIAAVSFAAPAITVVGLKWIAADLGGERSVPALAYSLAWLGASVGGVAMGQAAERFGVRATVIFGSLMIATGLLLAQSGNAMTLLIGYGVFIGLLGNAAMNAPLYIYVSRWFDRRRGTALALLGSGSSVSAAIWAPIFAAAEAQIGWRNTMLGFAVIEVSLILPARRANARPRARSSRCRQPHHRPAPGRPGARVTTGGCVIDACRRRFLLLGANGDAARPSCSSVHRCRDFGGSRRGDALDAARLCFSEPADLGPCCRPDRRLAYDLRRLRLPARSYGRFPGHPE